MSHSDSSSHRHSDRATQYSIYTDREHVKVAEMKGDGSEILGTIGQFCEAMYHVKSNYNLNDQERSVKDGCLGSEQCSLGRYEYPKTAVALVMFQKKNASSKEWETKSVRRYTNCYDDGKHAEDFFLSDIIKNPLEDGEWRLTMYITMQPCNKSTGKTRGTPDDHSCCKTILEAKDELNRNCKVELIIKPAHLMQAGWKKNEDSWDDKINNAEEGVKLLMKEGIKLEGLKKPDWDYLQQHISDPKLPQYEGSGRETLDEDIETFFARIRTAVKSEAKSEADLAQLVARLNVQDN
ncbi:uncharacterized protein LOC125560604 [Nematostella vectensis]|uniref:uncharacterized protein LOC125560604 n=1 Tax=Nematostella vectensis TaxID=45351 RepID=UPI0020773D5B|nr:uncharacterized protein LOC125560604 [Nematostella vectensis]